MIEFLPKGIDKGSSLLTLAKTLFVEQKNIIAIGDGLDDLSMFTVSGTTIAIENAVDEIKAIADFITLDNSNSGVKYGIEQFINLEEN